MNDQYLSSAGRNALTYHATVPVAADKSTFTDFMLVALFAFILRAPGLSLSVFGSSDESAFILGAREILRGNLPYVTFWDHKPPGSMLMLAAAMALFGQSVEVARGLGIACVACTGWLLYLIARRVWPDRLAALGAAVLYVAYSVHMCGSATMTEILLAPFTAAGVLLLLVLLTRASRRAAGDDLLISAAAGLAFGIAVLIKYVPALPAALTGGFALVVLLCRPEQGGGFARAAGRGLAFAAGLLLPTAVSVGLYWWRGALDVFWHANFGFAAAYVGLEDFTEARGSRSVAFQAVRGTGMAALQVWPLAAAAAAASLPSSLRFFAATGRSRHLAILGLWLSGEALAVAAQVKFYAYHFLLTLPPLCVLAAFALRFHVGRLAASPAAARATALVLGLMAAEPVLHHALPMAATLSREDVPRAIARVLAAEMSPGDRVYVVNHEPILYFLAGSPLPTRFAYPSSLVGPHKGVIDIDATAENRRILEGRPRFIVMNASWRDDPISWDGPAMAFAEETLARHYASRAAWIQADAKGTVHLFVRRD